MKILLVTDSLDNCSVHNRCKMLKKHIPECDFDIVDENYDIAGVLANYDLIHINYSIGAEKYLALVKEYPDKFMLTICNERSVLEKNKLAKWAYYNKDYLEMVRLCPRVTALNATVSNILNIEHIGNGFDEEVFTKSRKAIVGYVGTQQGNKNYKIIEDVCRDLDLEFKPQYYEKRIPFEQMNDYYLGLDVYVHASLTEGFSCVCLEALICNIPVIMTKTGNWEEYVGLATFIEPTYNSLYEALKKYNPRKFLASRYLWSIKAREYAKVYNDIRKQKNIQ